MRLVGSENKRVLVLLPEPFSSQKKGHSSLSPNAGKILERLARGLGRTGQRWPSSYCLMMGQLRGLSGGLDGETCFLGRRDCERRLAIYLLRLTSDAPEGMLLAP